MKVVKITKKQGGGGLYHVVVEVSEKELNKEKGEPMEWVTWKPGVTLSLEEDITDGSSVYYTSSS